MKKKDTRPVVAIPRTAKVGDLVTLHPDGEFPITDITVPGAPPGWYRVNGWGVFKDGIAYGCREDRYCIRFTPQSPAKPKREKVARVWKRWAYVSKDGSIMVAPEGHNRAFCRMVARVSGQGERVVKVEVREVRKCIRSSFNISVWRERDKP